jgi:hypothetical protein
MTETRQAVPERGTRHGADHGADEGAALLRAQSRVETRKSRDDGSTVRETGVAEKRLTSRQLWNERR